MEKEGSRAAEVIDFEEDRMEEEVDAVEQKDASSDRAISDSDEMVEQQVGSTSDRNVDLIDEADDTEEGPFVKVEYVRGRRTNGRRREELARLRAIAVDRAKDFFSETEDERGFVATEEEVRQKLNEYYSGILLGERRSDPNKKRSLKGLMLQRIKEEMEHGGWRIVSPSSISSPARLREAWETSAVTACACRARMGEMAEDVALNKEMILRLTARIEDLEKKLEKKSTTKNTREGSSGE